MTDQSFSTVDYKLLLTKYMAIIADQEGCDYLLPIGGSYTGITSVEENRILREISVEVDKHYEKRSYIFKESAIK